jgi:hypothetical protein
MSVNQGGAAFRIFGEDATAAAFRSVIGGSEKSAKAMEKIFRGAFGNIGGSAGSIGRHLGSIRMLLGVGGIAGAVGLVTVGFTALYGKIKESREEHERINGLADRLDLPSGKVKQYSEEWTKVATSLHDAARGFAHLSEERAKAFGALDLDPKETGSLDAAKTRIAAAEGSKQEKVEILRILTGLSYEEAEKELERELKRLNTVVGNNRRGGLTRQFEREGVEFGKEDVGFLRRSGQILAPAEFEDLKKLGEALDKLEESRQKLLGEQEKKDQEAAEKERIRAFEESALALQQLHAGELEIQEGVNDALEEGNKLIADTGDIAIDSILAMGEAWAEESEKMREEAAERAAEIKGIFDDGIFAAFEDGADAMLDYWADTLKKMAIQAAATEFFNMGSGGIGKAFSSLFKFADGGRPPMGRPSIVGERGPELFVPDGTGTIIPNHKLGGGGSAQVTIHVDARGAQQGVAQQLQALLPAVVREAVNQSLAIGNDRRSRGYA